MSDRTTDLAHIHCLWRDLGIDEDTYRAVLHRATGRWSAGDLDELRRRKAITALRALLRKQQEARMIRTLRIQGFRALKSADLDLGAITLVYCEKGTGKTGVRDAIRYALTGLLPVDELHAQVRTRGVEELFAEVVWKEADRSLLRSYTTSHRCYTDGVEIGPALMSGLVQGFAGLSAEAAVCALGADQLPALPPERLASHLGGLLTRDAAPENQFLTRGRLLEVRSRIEALRRSTPALPPDGEVERLTARLAELEADASKSQATLDAMDVELKRFAHLSLAITKAKPEQRPPCFTCGTAIAGRERTQHVEDKKQALQKKYDGLQAAHTEELKRVEAAREELALARRAIAAAAAAEELPLLEARAAELERELTGSDRAAEAAKRLTEACKPAAELLAPGATLAVSEVSGVYLSAGGTSVPVSQVAERDRKLLEICLLYGAARVSGLPLLVLDDVHQVTGDDRAHLWTLVRRASSEGLQPILLLEGKPPAKAASGAVVYRLHDGLAERVETSTKAGRAA